MQSRRASTYALGMTVFLLAVAHGVFAWSHRALRPDFAILDPPPSARATAAFSLGDRQFLYRWWALDLQNAGDTGGRTTAMRDYDYEDVLAWLTALSDLDPQGQHHLMLAVHYFSQTPKIEDVRHLVQFIINDVARAPSEKALWLAEAITLAEQRLSDPSYALVIARQLASYYAPGSPNWTLMMPAILLQKMGRIAEAEAEIEKVGSTYAALLQREDRLFIESFTQRLHQAPKY